jgi:hypothetical protein
MAIPYKIDAAASQHKQARFHLPDRVAGTDTAVKTGCHGWLMGYILEHCHGVVMPLSKTASNASRYVGRNCDSERLYRGHSKWSWYGGAYSWSVGGRLVNYLASYERRIQKSARAVEGRSRP